MAAMSSRQSSEWNNLHSLYDDPRRALCGDFIVFNYRALTKRFHKLTVRSGKPDVMY